MKPATHRRLSLGEALAGQPVEYLGDTAPARRGEQALEPDESRPLYSGHPGKVHRDYGGGGRHLVIHWYGLEDTDESTTGSGYEWDESETYPGLGWLEPADYDQRCARLAAGIPPMEDETYVPVTLEDCERVEGPFFHGTKTVLAVGDELVAGRGSNFHAGRIMNNIYFAALVETAAWGAELSAALAGLAERGHVYIVEPLGPFEDDPNVTNKRFPGNITQSYRSRYPLRIVGEVTDWEGHDPEVLKGMLDNLARMREQGLDLIED